LIVCKYSMPLNTIYLDKIYVFDLEEIPSELHNQLYKLISNEFLNSVFGYIGGRNICLNNIQDKIVPEFTSQLYKIFYSLSKEILGTVTLSESNSKTCWANLSDADYYLSSIHNHKNTATVNGVYYFNMPENCGGELDFYNNNNKVIQTISPKQSQLVLFPGYLNHKNRYCNSKQFRISINLEITCNETF